MRDILIWIQILGSVLFDSALHDANKNFFKFFCLLLFVGTFTSFFTDIKSPKEVTKQ
jgi:hypothetical protein